MRFTYLGGMDRESRRDLIVNMVGLHDSLQPRALAIGDTGCATELTRY